MKIGEKRILTREVEGHGVLLWHLCLQKQNKNMRLPPKNVQEAEGSAAADTSCLMTTSGSHTPCHPHSKSVDSKMGLTAGIQQAGSTHLR